MFAIFLLSLLVQTLIINKIAKQGIYTSFGIALLRSLGSYFNTDIFKVSDLNVHFFSYIKSCQDTQLFDFHKLGIILNCSGLITTVKGINLIYGCLGCLSISILINLGTKLYKNKFNLFSNSKERYQDNNLINNYKFIKLSQILILIDPAGIIYTGAIGKDVFLFSTIVSLLYLLFYPSFLVFIFFSLVTLTCLKDRPYIALFLSAASLLALYLPNLKFANFSKRIFFNLPTKIIPKIKTKFILIYIIFIPLLLLVIFKVLTEFYVSEFSISSIFNYLNYWARDIGEGGSGVLNFASNTIFPIKYLYFWILPFPILQSGLGSLVFGISTLNYLFFIFKIIQKGLIINNYKIKFLVSILIVFSVLFSYISFNSGITSRYKFTSCIPPLYILFLYSNVCSIKYDNKK